MIKITDNLSGEALLLWEAAAVFDLDVEELAPCVGVTVDRIYEWFGGGQLPSEDEKSKILAGVEKMDRSPDGTEPVMKEVRPGVFAGARWGKGSKPTEEAKKYDEEIDRFFNELEQRDPKANLTDDDYIGFQNVLEFARRLKVQLPRL